MIPRSVVSPHSLVQIMSTSSEENIYLTLELFLDPPTLNFGELKKELAGKITAWQPLSNTPGSKYKHMVQVAEMFCKRTTPPGPPDEATLATQAAEARKQCEANGRREAATYEEDGILEQKEYDALLKAFRPYFKEVTIKSWFSLEVTPDFVVPAEITYPSGVKEKIVPKSQMDQIAEDLKIILGNEKASLYDLLGLVQTTNLETIRKTQEDAYDKACKKPKSGAESAKVDAEIRILGRAKIIFENELSRQGYDIAKKRRPFDRLVDEKFQKRAFKGSITHGEYIRSIEDTCRIGFSQAEAERLVYEFYCIKRKFPPPKRPIELPARQQCPECFTLNDVNAEVCRCGIPLKITCRCGHVGSFRDRVCTKCGFPLGDMPNALKRIEMAKEAVVAKDIDGAEEHIRYIDLYWEDAPGADALRKSLEELKEKLKAISQRIKDFESNIKDAIGKRFVYEARRLFHELRQIPEAAAYLQAEEKLVFQTIDTVQKELVKLALINALPEKIELCETILSQAADCIEAKTALAQIPPLPPENLIATVIPTGVSLKWTAPTSGSNLTFVVVRKVGGTPSSLNDGIRLHDNVTHSSFVDSTVDVGIVYGYAVFTQRDKTIETTGNRSSLVQKIEDIRNVSILPGNGTLTVSWKKQSGSRGMLVTRFMKKASENDGVRVPLQHETSFVDSNLDNGTLYSYKIQTVFRGIDGKEIFSPGKIVSAKPQVPPKAVVDLKTSDPGDGTTILQWSQPPQGEVLLFDLPDEPDIPIGTTEWTTPAELRKRYGDTIPVLAKGQTLWKNTSTGVRNVLPLTFSDGLVVFGKSVSVVKIGEVSDLDINFSGTKLRLTWEWPKGLQKVLIAYRHDQFPKGPTDSQSAKVILNRQEYDIEKSWILPIGDSQEYYFCVYAVIEQNARSAFSQGVRIQTAKIMIKYRLSISRKFIFWGQVDAKIILTNESQRDGFPEMVVKRDFGRPPLTRDHGVPFFSIPSTNERRLVKPLSIEQLEEGTYIKIFLKNPRDSDRYVLDHPSRDNVHLCCKRKTLRQLYREIINSIIGK